MNIQQKTRLVSLCKPALAAATLALALCAPAQAQTYVNMTVGGAFAPGVYGQISLGNNPPPPVWNAQPVVVGHPVYGAAPMYLHVPQAEYRDWGRYCGRYQACGHPVHFVRVEENNRWWEQRNGNGRAEGHHRKHEDERRAEWRDDGRGERHAYRYGYDADPRFESRRGER